LSARERFDDNAYIKTDSSPAIVFARSVHSEKKGFRVFGVAESFKKGRGNRSTLAGVVMRRDLVIDGVAVGSAALGGNDATDCIVGMYKSLARDDINCILLDGLVISMYNIINAEQIVRETGIPVVAITFEDSKGLEGIIKHRFDDWRPKLEQYQKLGQRERITLKTGKSLFIRYWETNNRRAMAILNAFTLQGSVPEPVRVAKLVARACFHNALN
jgi:endonuclease V-like protein UPF0215 family